MVIRSGMLVGFDFFFSSRRRHTRWNCDWSSDVCSSDLDGARFDGWSEYFSYDRWERCAAEALAGDGVDLAWYTTRERGYGEVLPWDHLDAGLDRDWLWQDWLAAIDPAGAAEVEDCRWTPCFECG